MNTASQIVDAIALAVQPPRGTAIVLTESPDGIPNWITATGPMDRARTDNFIAKVAALRKSDPVIDWSDCKEMDGDRRRAAKWLSEVAGV